MTKLLVNIDTDDIGIRFLNALVDRKDDIIEADLFPFIDQYVGISDLILCLNSQYSVSESKIVSDSIFKYEQTVENGVAVDYKDKYHGIYTVYQKHGIDPFKVWFDRCRNVGITPWMSFRMNDRHCSRDMASNLRPEFFYEAQKNGWMLGERYGSFKTCMNYAFPEVREMWLGYIDEQLEKYDTFGLELDFQREIYCLDYLSDPDCHEIMTEFIRKVREITNLHAKKKGHRIKLGIRLTRDLDQSRIFGFDSETYVREGLVDMIVPTPRWETNDSDMPIAEWKERLHGTEIHAGLETLIYCGGDRLSASADAVRGLANRYLSDGADGLYFYNFYPDPTPTTVTDILRRQRSLEVFSTCCDTDTMRSFPMRYIVTEQDVVPEGIQRYAPLPITMDGESKTLELNIGKTPHVSHLGLIIGYNGVSPSDVRLTVNGEATGSAVEYSPRPEGLRETDTDRPCGYVPVGSHTYRYELMPTENGRYELDFRADTGKITYVEFEI